MPAVSSSYRVSSVSCPIRKVMCNESAIMFTANTLYQSTMPLCTSSTVTPD